MSWIFPSDPFINEANRGEAPYCIPCASVAILPLGAVSLENPNPKRDSRSQKAAMKDYSFIDNADPAAIDTMFQQYHRNPASIDPSWVMFFSGYKFGLESGEYCSRSCQVVRNEDKVLKLIEAYRGRGHLFTKINPVRSREQHTPAITPEYFGLKEEDRDVVFLAGNEIGIGPSSLDDIVRHLEETYCHSVGAEFKYIRHPEIVKWLQVRMENCRNRPDFTETERVRILENLTRAVLFELFMDKKYIGQKRFSLEGVEAVIPAINAVIDSGAELGVECCVLGMAHRGRLNVLANVVGKPFADIFFEYKGIDTNEARFVGDVKYHMGYSNDVPTPNGKRVHVSLSMNPSHLEAVDPIVMGKARSQLNHNYDGDLDKVVPILIHGDAAIAGQGVVYEVIQMSMLEGYRTGGTVHIILNNQLGFTTASRDGRSSTYCTDVAKVTLSPVFHVNGDDIEAVVYTVGLAMEFRQKFHRDVFIDIMGYRKHGHNESDEPRFTQPILYKTIAAHPNPLEIYTGHILARELIDPQTPARIKEETTEMLNSSFDQAQNRNHSDLPAITGSWRGFRRSVENEFVLSPLTGVDRDLLDELLLRMNHLPEDRNFFNKTRRLFEDRKTMYEARGIVNWALGELLAYASLLHEGFPVRLSGQDCGRGTFSHRHAILTIEDSEEKYVPLRHLSRNQAKFDVYNSPLSEYGVLGFEAGYAYDNPNALTVWEAQFGDFANVAQVIFDQFLSCSEVKWHRMCGLVVLLPHGYEGQGSEHSSARVERFLSLCADNNLQVVNCSTPANMFHVLRRQLYRYFRKPLIVFTPKSLLRHPQCVSRVEEIEAGKAFQEIYDDKTVDPEKVRRVLLCTGKVFYELAAEREERGIEDIAIVRLEQLYPLPELKLEQLLGNYGRSQETVWVQEEPENMGAWPFLFRKLHHFELKGVCRKECGTTATGFSQRHAAEQRELLERALQSGTL